MAALQQRSQLRTPVAHELDAFKTYLEETCVTLSRAFAVLAPSKVPGPQRTLDCLPHCSHIVLATVAGATLAPVDALHARAQSCLLLTEALLCLCSAMLRLRRARLWSLSPISNRSSTSRKRTRYGRACARARAC